MLVLRQILITGKLFLDELVVRLVVIERVDHVITVTPSVWPIHIEFKLAGIGNQRVFKRLDVLVLERSISNWAESL